MHVVILHNQSNSNITKKVKPEYENEGSQNLLMEIPIAFVYYHLLVDCYKVGQSHIYKTQIYFCREGLFITSKGSFN